MNLKLQIRFFSALLIRTLVADDFAIEAKSTTPISPDFESDLVRLCRERLGYLRAHETGLEIGKFALGRPSSPVLDCVPEDLIHAILAERKK